MEAGLALSLSLSLSFYLSRSLAQIELRKEQAGFICDRWKAKGPEASADPINEGGGGRAILGSKQVKAGGLGMPPLLVRTGNRLPSTLINYPATVFQIIVHYIRSIIRTRHDTLFGVRRGVILNTCVGQGRAGKGREGQGRAGQDEDGSDRRADQRETGARRKKRKARKRQRKAKNAIEADVDSLWRLELDWDGTRIQYDMTSGEWWLPPSLGDFSNRERRRPKRFVAPEGGEVGDLTAAWL
ncbi:hypothetical protein LY76DRAFT_610565 [Colletotrichum caudatum]|nr:hypothetical protein LY76DRAFT_610565 [Colletotrichum caudatum]